MSNYYGLNAYCSNQPRHQRSQAELPHKGFAMRLPWGHTPNRVTRDLQDKRAVKLGQQEAQRLKKYGSDIPRQQWAIHNHEYLQQGNYSKFSIILNMILAFRMLAIPATFVVIVSYIWIYLLEPPASITEWLYSNIEVFLIIPGIFYYLWIISLVIIKFCPKLLMLKGNGRIKWRINRRTGMVSHFSYPQKGQVVEQTAPFDEFDAYLCISGTRHGFVYDFILYHRYDGWLVGLEGQVPIKANKEPYQEEWEFIQNYMDISKPLPEDPVLENYRHLDPVTKAYDQSTNRDPHKLRKMTEKQWQTYYETINQQAIPIMERRPCLFQEGGYVVYLPDCQWHPKQ